MVSIPKFTCSVQVKEPPVIFSLSEGQSGDAPEGRKLLKTLGKTKNKKFLLMYKAYEGDETRSLAESLNFIPVIPPKSNRKAPWKYDKILESSN